MSHARREHTTETNRAAERFQPAAPLRREHGATPRQGGMPYQRESHPGTSVALRAPHRARALPWTRPGSCAPRHPCRWACPIRRARGHGWAADAGGITADQGGARCSRHGRRTPRVSAQTSQVWPGAAGGHTQTWEVCIVTTARPTGSSARTAECVNRCETVQLGDQGASTTWATGSRVSPCPA